jgi:hypothetical protein
MLEYQHPQDLSKREWIALARSTRIEDVLEKRGHMLDGAGPERRGMCSWCGGFNRLAVNLRQQRWFCSGCERGGDVVALIEHFDRVSFLDACAALTGYAAPGRRHSNGKREGVSA